jgi:hypothetical protein
MPYNGGVCALTAALPYVFVCLMVTRPCTMRRKWRKWDAKDKVKASLAIGLGNDVAAIGTLVCCADGYWAKESVCWAVPGYVCEVCDGLKAQKYSMWSMRMKVLKQSSL